MSETVREHYIPQFYLKNFSQDKKRIYQYRINSNSSSKLVSIEGICCENNLYEYRNDNGEFVCRNLIENCFSKIEGEFCDIIRSIVSKASHEENFNTLCFLTSKEKALLTFFVATMIMRNPRVLNAAKETTIEFFNNFDNNLSENMMYNLVLKKCLPIYKELDGMSKSILNILIERLSNMSFQIGVANSTKIFTSDDPVLVLGECIDMKIDEVLLPLTSSTILMMKQFKQTKMELRNRLVSLDSDDVKAINDRTIAHCQNWIYSQNEITNKQIRHIEKQKGAH